MIDLSDKFFCICMMGFFLAVAVFNSILGLRSLSVFVSFQVNVATSYCTEPIKSCLLVL